ncbi:carbonic anhydrase 1-like [Leptopilina heterotoma]|uniref:carbonic anhydrase 1-like n=1 Tax=Leptopilina heterotoma TaxID=63436 RepID=UPI001CA80CFA|nr:carbonic anhydrase 1-like [Leptopilina heterotoma]
MIDPTLPEFLVGVGIFLLFVLLLSEIVDGVDMFSMESCGYSNSISFGYDNENGPHKWKLLFPESDGCSQSPINIVTRLAVVLQSSEPLKWSGYRSQPTSMSLENDGNSVMVTGVWSGGAVPNVTKGPLNDTYNFHSMIFHWGPANDEGSEHTMDYIKYTMELQMVHVKKCYTSPKDPSLLHTRDAVAIISYFLQITNVDNPYLDHIVTNLWRITKTGTKVSIPPFPLEWLYPPFECSYYSYNGSLTQPPCTEMVTWIIQPEPIAVSSFQVAQFRKIRSVNGNRILLNTRPVQKLYDREVYFYD